MRELERRQKFKKRLYSLPSLCLLAIFAGLVVKGTVNVFRKKAESAVYVSALETKVSELDKENTELSAHMASIGTSEGVEKLLKERFNVTKPGEHEAILVDAPAASSTGPADSRAWYERLWDGILSVL